MVHSTPGSVLCVLSLDVSGIDLGLRQSTMAAKGDPSVP
jgi:hypothetical protein